jgi:hypothetical protein
MREDLLPNNPRGMFLIRNILILFFLFRVRTECNASAIWWIATITKMRTDDGEKFF